MHTNTFIKEIEKVVSPGGVLLAEGALGIVTRAGTATAFAQPG